MSESVDRSDMIQSFMSITDVSSVTTATYWLEAADFSIDGAINLFFSSITSAPVSAVNTSSAAISATHSDYRESGDDVMNVDDIYQGFENPNDISKSGFMGEEVIRKPDTVKKQRLMDIQNDYFEFQAKKEAMSKSLPVSTFACATDRTVSEKDLTLAKLFQAPHDLMTQGFLSDVREICKTEGKWLLVNIQREEDFNCHLANRDFWSDENIKEIINCGFLFWQVQNISLEGSEFCKNYRVETFPHIAVIDPRTGASIWTYAKKINAEMFSEKLMDFLGSNPYPDDSDDIVAVGGGGGGGGAKPQIGGGAGGGGGAGRGTQTPVVQNQNQTLSSGTIAPVHGAGFDPSKLPTISGLEDLKSADTPIIKILFKIPSSVGAGMKPKSFSLPLNTTVVMLASHAASMVLKGKKNSFTRTLDRILV